MTATSPICQGYGPRFTGFNETNLKPLEGYLAIGHNRYSTTGASHLRNASPYLIETVHGPLGVAHNGNLTNALELRQELLERGVGLASTTDSEVITQMLASKADSWAEGHPAHLDNWERRLWSMMHVAEGAYSLIVLTRNAIYAMRLAGIAPLCIGELNGGGYVVASESCALMTIGAEFVREVEPGEIVRINASRLRSTQVATANKRALCI